MTVSIIKETYWMTKQRKRVWLVQYQKQPSQTYCTLTYDRLCRTEKNTYMQINTSCRLLNILTTTHIYKVPLFIVLGYFGVPLHGIRLFRATCDISS